MRRWPGCAGRKAPAALAARLCLRPACAVRRSYQLKTRPRTFECARLRSSGIGDRGNGPPAHPHGRCANGCWRRGGWRPITVWPKKEKLLGKMRSIFRGFHFDANVFKTSVVFLHLNHPNSGNISHGVPRSVDMIKAFLALGGACGGAAIMCLQGNSRH